MEQPVRVGVLADSETYSARSIVHAIRELGHVGFLISREELTTDVGVDGVSVTPAVDVLFNWCKAFRGLGTLEVLGTLRQVEASDIQVLNTAQALFDANHKGASMATLRANGIQVPQTTVSAGGVGVAEASNRRGKHVHKTTMGGGGTDVELLDPDDEPGLFRREDTGLIQQYIETEGEAHRDVRAFVVGDEVVAAMERKAPDDDWRTNISQGGSGTDVGCLEGDAFDMAVETVQTLGLDASGVDLIQSEDGEWAVIEANTPAGCSGLEDATGINVGPYIAEYCLRQAGVACDWDTVHELGESIDLPDTVAGTSGSLYDIRQKDELPVSGHKRATDVELDVDMSREHSRISPELAAGLGCQLVWDKDLNGTINTEEQKVKLTVLAEGYRETCFPVLDESLDGEDGVDLILHLGVFTDFQVGQSSDETPN